MPTTNNDRFRISELAAQADVNPKTVRYYESVGLLPEPGRLPNGYRVYSEQDLSRLLFIRRAQGLGLSLDSIRDILHLRTAGDQPCRHIHELAKQKVVEIDQQIAELQRLRTSLADLAERAALVEECEGDETNGICPAIEAATS